VKPSGRGPWQETASGAWLCPVCRLVLLSRLHHACDKHLRYAFPVRGPGEGIAVITLQGQPKKGPRVQCLVPSLGRSGVYPLEGFRKQALCRGQGFPAPCQLSSSLT